MNKQRKLMKRELYNQEVMTKALEEVRSGMPINTASKKYNVPRSTLHSKFKNLYTSSKRGPRTVLIAIEEDNLTT